MESAVNEKELSMVSLDGLEYLPGGEILLKALHSFNLGQWETEQALLVSLYTRRLASVGITIPKSGLPPLSIKLKLYEKLSSRSPDPYAEFKAIEQRLLKLLTYLEREFWLKQIG